MLVMEVLALQAKISVTAAGEAKAVRPAQEAIVADAAPGARMERKATP